MQFVKSVVSLLLSCAVVTTVRAQSQEFNALSRSTIVAQTMSTANICGDPTTYNRLQPGAILVYQTNGGRYGKMQIKEYGLNLIIKWKTYNSDGTVYSSGDSLTVPESYSCDLDGGSICIVTTQGSDFRWTVVSSSDRYLDPQNTAQFAVYLRSYEDVDAQYSGYVSDQETRFVSYVWGFLSHYSNSPWVQSQYYWGHCYQIGSSHLSYADAADLAYLAGHGSASSITLHDGEGSCDLSTMGWGSYSSAGRTGDLEYIVFHSCSVLSTDALWRSRWKMQSSTDVKPFSGLHVAMGYRTSHYNGDDAGPACAEDFADNLEDGLSVRYAWYKAAADNRSHTTENKPSIFYVASLYSETIDHFNSMDYRYGDSEYLINAYYMN